MTKISKEESKVMRYGTQDDLEWWDVYVEVFTDTYNYKVMEVSQTYYFRSQKEVDEYISILNEAKKELPKETPEEEFIPLEELD